MTDTSDHFPVFAINLQSKGTEMVTMTFRKKYYIQNKNKFIDITAAVEWPDIYDYENT